MSARVSEKRATNPCLAKTLCHPRLLSLQAVNFFTIPGRSHLCRKQRRKIRQQGMHPGQSQSDSTATRKKTDKDTPSSWFSSTRLRSFRCKLAKSSSLSKRASRRV